VGDIDLKVISAAENSNKFQKTRFWKEKSVEDVVTLVPTAQATLAKYEKTCGSTDKGLLEPTTTTTTFFLERLEPNMASSLNMHTGNHNPNGDR